MVIACDQQHTVSVEKLVSMLRQSKGSLENMYDVKHIFERDALFDQALLSPLVKLLDRTQLIKELLID